MVEQLKSLCEQATDSEASTPQRLLAAATLRGVLDEYLEALAATARSEGHTWAELGTVLGVTKQAVQKRWGSSTVVIDTTDPGADPRVLTVEEAEAEFPVQ